ncbi:MFS transporter [Streptomyces sp. CA-146814]|uniref:MFS transporter n=1 Tax=Streptomyces sp. CA-146814 TaxID=3240053 RepID=UPI003D8B568E
MAVLVLAQILSGAGLTAGVTVGALLADHMLGSTEFAGVPSALFTAGAALGAVSIGRWCAARGRRPGLTLGYATGALGSIGVVAAASTGSVALLFPALLVYGVGTATGLMARYAGADLASPARRGRAVSTVLFATTLGAVAGPMLVTPVGEVAATWGVPRLAGTLSATAPADSLPALSTALVLLGLGWNFGLISGTAIVTDALHPDRRATTEGLVDVGIAIAGAAGSLVSGLVVGRSGYPVLALAGGVVALAVIPIVTGRARKGGATALGKERSRSPR